MTTSKLKICGITRLEDARYAAAAGADYLGFIQYEGSPRFIDPSKVRELLGWIYGPTPVGVFVDVPSDEVNRAADEAGFEVVQLHGDEPAFDVARIERPIIKALRVRRDTTAEDLARQFREYEAAVDYFLLDTHAESAQGGTGKTFDWSVVGDLARDYPVFLAGGINADNVERAVGDVRPFAIDVSSALESSPGHKDFAKIDAFMAAFRRARAASQAEH